MVTIEWEPFGTKGDVFVRFYSNDTLSGDVITLRAGSCGRRRFFYEFQRGGTILSNSGTLASLEEAQAAAVNAWHAWAKANAEGAGWLVVGPTSPGVRPQDCSHARANPGDRFCCSCGVSLAESEASGLPAAAGVER